MTSRTVKYWHQIDEYTREPLATNWPGLRIEMQARGLLWCKSCKVAVDPEGACDADSVYDICPFCNEEIQEHNYD